MNVMADRWVVGSWPGLDLSAAALHNAGGLHDKLNRRVFM